jgi:hypothetical protein
MREVYRDRLRTRFGWTKERENNRRRRKGQGFLKAITKK